MKWLVRRLLERAPVLVAADEDDPGAIWGWAATHGSTVLYIFVRQEFRHRGIARMLLAPYLSRTGITYAAKSSHRIRIPDGWTYSFLAAMRIAAE